MDPVNELQKDAIEPTLVSDETPADKSRGLKPCCIGTLSIHARFNQMMVCTGCKQIIKSFKDEKAFKNYLKFCESRHRKVVTDTYQGMNILVFHSYEKF